MKSDSGSCFLVANIFGMTSPKSRMMKVMTSTSRIRPSRGFPLKSKRSELIKAARSTAAMFTVLLATRMVLRRVSGESQSFSTIAAFLDLLAFSFSMSSGRSEKKATSDPDIRADIKSSMIRTTRPTITFRSM